MWESAPATAVQRIGRLYFEYNIPKSYLSQVQNGDRSDSANSGQLGQGEGNETKKGRVLDVLWAGQRDG